MAVNKGRFLIITGMSGAGKSLVVNTLEDIGYFCVDNLPPALLTKFAEICKQGSGISKVALVVDIRGGKLFDNMVQALEDMERNGYSYEILFFDAKDETLIRRFKETRRSHPLAQQDCRLVDAINREREILAPIKGRATTIIDTSALKAADLREKIINICNEDFKADLMALNIVSFGFKHGVPLDADMLFDVRFLPNPFYIDDLRYKSGEQEEVSQYIEQWPITLQFKEKMFALLDFLLPNYISEGKRQFEIAIGCTGGMHRSVHIACCVAARYREAGYKLSLVHRDIKLNKKANNE